MSFRNDKQKSFLERITNKKFNNGVLELGLGHKIYDFYYLSDDEKRLFPKQKSIYKAVLVLADAKKLDSINLTYKKQKLFGKRVKQVKFEDHQWDILLVEGN